MRFVFSDSKKGLSIEIDCLSVPEVKQLLTMGMELHEKGKIESDFKEIGSSPDDLRHAILTILMDGLPKDLADIQYAIYSRRLEPGEPDYIKVSNQLYQMKKKGIICRNKGLFTLRSSLIEEE